ncbi:thiol:disulfide interchange protein DsbD [Marinobacterium nitratireducens]|uniref:Thiol:disulfide interchange protein DsbD n=1 Tax=Marinobacterium nitratireducens TaxID=518897 RepID=A0A917Z7A5_9GAMM|nr:protein-disulfide reductase DsbD [Marinobacterium nitratireducens]GGO77055.1 thiol:disulfide interchange protein DsbD [Marinobacterium nitratireducens]
MRFNSFRCFFAGLLLLAGLGFQAQAGLFDSNPFGKDGPLQVDDAFHMDFEQLEPGKVRLLWTIQPDYYLYRDRMEFSSLDGRSEVVGRIDAPSEEKDDPLFGKVQVYHEFAEVELQLASLSTEAVDDRISISYQGCWEGGICYPPVTREISLAGIPSRDIGGVGTPVAGSGTDAGPGDAAGAVAAAAPASAVSYGVGSEPVSEQDRFVGLLRNAGLAVTLGAFFVAGLALSFTPCVFPMIPIISSIIAGHGHRISTARALGLSLVYVLAVAVTYTLAGVFTGLFGANLQAAFQNTWIIAAFSMLFVLLALSMFGFYELQLPSSWQSRLTRASNRRHGGTIIGVAAMGLLSALIVGPCMAAPLAGALIYIGQAGDPVLGGLALFSLSLGMGVPLLLVGASAGKLLPKAGLWMEAVKAAFGVALLLMAIWMLDRIIPTRATMALTALVLIVSAVYMNALDRLPDQSGGWHRLWKGVGLILLVYGLALMVGLFAGSRSLVYPLQGLAGGQTERASLAFSKVTSMDQLQPMLEQAQRSGQPVMLDFFADWCVSCYELEYVTFDDDRVRQALSGFQLIKVDVTANDDAAQRLSREYGVVGPPALLFYDAQGTLKPQLTLIGVIQPEDFLRHLQRLEG